MTVHRNAAVTVINGAVVWTEYVCHRVTENLRPLNGELKVDIGMREREREMVSCKIRFIIILLSCFQ